VKTVDVKIFVHGNYSDCLIRTLQDKTVDLVIMSVNSFNQILRSICLKKWTQKRKYRMTRNKRPRVWWLHSIPSIFSHSTASITPTHTNAQKKEFQSTTHRSTSRLLKLWDSFMLYILLTYN